MSYETKINDIFEIQSPMGDILVDAEVRISPYKNCDIRTKTQIKSVFLISDDGDFYKDITNVLDGLFLSLIEYGGVCSLRVYIYETLFDMIHHEIIEKP